MAFEKIVGVGMISLIKVMLKCDIIRSLTLGHIVS